MKPKSSAPKKTRLKHRHVYEAMRRAVLAGDYPPGALLPGERVLADKYRVSYMTARRAVEDLVMEGLYERRGKRTYVSQGADDLARSETLNILCLALDPSTVPLVQMAEKSGRNRRWIPHLIVIRGNNDRIAIEAIESGRPSIVLANDPVLQGGIGRAVIRCRGSAVLVGNQMEGEPVFSVCGNDDEMMRLSMEHLQQLGHRDIIFAYRSAQEYELPRPLARRKEVFHSLLTSDRKDSSVRVDDKAYPSHPAAARAAIHSYLKRQRRRPTAVICNNNQLAVGVLHGLRDLGLRVPEDFSVMTFGDSVLSEYSVPSLTAVDVEYEKHIKVAMNILTASREGRPPAKLAHIIPPKLIVRESTARLSR